MTGITLKRMIITISDIVIRDHCVRSRKLCIKNESILWMYKKFIIDGSLARNICKIWTNLWQI